VSRVGSLGIPRSGADWAERGAGRRRGQRSGWRAPPSAAPTGWCQHHGDRQYGDRGPVGGRHGRPGQDRSQGRPGL